MKDKPSTIRKAAPGINHSGGDGDDESSGKIDEGFSGPTGEFHLRLRMRAFVIRPANIVSRKNPAGSFYTSLAAGSSRTHHCIGSSPLC